MRKALIYMLMVSLCLMVAGVATAQEVQEKTPPEESAELPEVDLPPINLEGEDEGGGPPTPCNMVPGNLVANCGFETGTFASWTRSGNPGFTGVTGTARYTGNFGGQFGPIGSLGFIAQNLATTAGQSYTLTFPLRNNGGPNRLQVSWNGQIIFDSSTGDYDYHRVLSGFTGLVATGASTELKFGMQNDPDYYYIDDIVVIPQ